MTPNEYLRRIPERMPQWLERFSPGDRFDRDAFFSSRVVYYPGSGFDGHAVKLFGSSHSAHSFIYVDYGITRDRIKQELADPAHTFRGYRTVGVIRLGMEDLTPSGWLPHPPQPIRHPFIAGTIEPFGLLAVLELDNLFDHRHGPWRLAVLFLGADGIATYDALFCQKDGTQSPFAILLQDHGFGGNYDRFGGGGLMEGIALKSNALPQFLLVGENTKQWSGYKMVNGLEAEHGGMHWNDRRLFVRSSVSD